MRSGSQHVWALLGALLVLLACNRQNADAGPPQSGDGGHAGQDAGNESSGSCAAPSGGLEVGCDAGMDAGRGTNPGTPRPDGGNEAGAEKSDAGALTEAGSDASVAVDVFGVRMIYPTAPNGREWFMNAADPTSDGQFASVPDSVQPSQNLDGTWRISREDAPANNGVRLDVRTPAGLSNWLNVEMTGYVKLVSSSAEEEFAWRTTSGTPHTNPCDGYAYYGAVKFDGSSARFLKEVWHSGGYVSSPAFVNAPTEPLLGRWVGIKVMRYNIMSKTQVRLELWLDVQADNTWRSVLQDVDTGWAVASPFPDGANCIDPNTGQPKTLDVIMTWRYPLVTYRADNATFDFKSFSVREIEPPQ